MMIGVNMVHLPYRGAAPALTDLLGGQVQMLFADISSIEYIKAGKLCPLAVTTATRSEVLPDVPTGGEFVPGFGGSSWYGIAAPKNTPKCPSEFYASHIRDLHPKNPCVGGESVKFDEHLNRPIPVTR